MSEDLLIATFCSIDDFCASFEEKWHRFLINCHRKLGKKSPSRSPALSMSEILTIAIFFHQSKYRTFKHYYLFYVQCHLRKFFPRLISYSRIVQHIQRELFPLFCYLQTVIGKCTSLSFIDSTLLTVCHNKRISSHKVFKNLAKRGKTSTGWFLGFKLHLVINEKGEILAYRLTAGNVDDRKPVYFLVRNCFGRLFGDKGYLSSKLFKILYQRGIKLVTRLRSNMKNKLMSVADKLLLRSRGIIESVNNLLKNSFQILHHRHRSGIGFLVNLLSGLAAYQLKPQKPSLTLSTQEKFLLSTALS